ncbi:MAG: hypothetical protein QOF61_666 [Acidobacteriota bacterium]|jgi:hypothetical protein|nr:hypothetical protein [Acidobacteriota bacterium]
MKNFRKIFAVSVLTLVLTHAAAADDGIIHGDRQPTPTPTPVAPTNPVSSGETSPVAASSNELTATDMALEIAWFVLNEMLALY